jgi:hypothetical protein
VPFAAESRDTDFRIALIGTGGLGLLSLGYDDFFNLRLQLS